MEKQHKSIADVSVLIIIALSLTGFRCTEPVSPPVAEVDNISIESSYFLKRYRDFLNTVYVADNLKYRYLFLESLIDERLLIKQARETGLMKINTSIKKLDNIRKQLLLNALYNHDIKANLTCSDQELRQLFIWTKTRLHVRHLFSRAENQIRIIHREVLKGANWDSLAAIHFHDPVLAGNGGDLGFFELGDFDPAFEATAFTLSNGEISQPVRTAYGYSIIQVIERETDPFITEDEYLHQKKWLKVIGKNYKKRPFLRSYTDEATAELNTVFDPVNLKKLYDQLPEILNLDKEYSLIAGDETLATGNNSRSWDLSTAVTMLRSLSEHQQKFLRSEDDLVTVLKGCIIREYLIDRACSQGFDQTDSFKSQFRQQQDNLAVRQVLSQIYQNNSNVNDNSLENRNLYFSFRDSLKSVATISIDSMQIKAMNIEELI